MKHSTLKPGKALICGSMAFDTIMVFADRFRNHILPDKLHMLNVSFLTMQMWQTSTQVRRSLPLIWTITRSRPFTPAQWATHTSIG